jgi:hypothetical protein
MLLGVGSRWGFVIGLATQPFWFYTSFRHRQWGIFIASIFYAVGWAIGVYRELCASSSAIDHGVWMKPVVNLLCQSRP